MYLFEVGSELQLEDICARGWEALENVLITWLVFHSRQAGQTISSVCSTSSNQLESCIYLCTSIRIVKSGSFLVAAQNNMQSYFDRPNDNPDKTKIRSYHRIKIAVNLKKIYVSVDQEKFFSILGPKLSGSKAQQYYDEKLQQFCF